MGGSGEKKGLVYSIFRGQVSGLSRSMNSMTHTSNSPKIYTSANDGEIISAMASFRGTGVGYTCPAHIWWATKVESEAIANPSAGTIWKAIKDYRNDPNASFGGGYLGVVNVGFCL